MPEDAKKERFKLGAVGWLVLITLAIVGGWVVVGNFLDFARPFWGYVSVASIAFTCGTFYGRYRKDTKKQKSP